MKFKPMVLKGLLYKFLGASAICLNPFQPALQVIKHAPLLELF